jgi:hypothetical protein
MRGLQTKNLEVFQLSLDMENVKTSTKIQKTSNSRSTGTLRSRLQTSFRQSTFGVFLLGMRPISRTGYQRSLQKFFGVQLDERRKDFLYLSKFITSIPTISFRSVGGKKNTFQMGIILAPLFLVSIVLCIFSIKILREKYQTLTDRNYLILFAICILSLFYPYYGWLNDGRVYIFSPYFYFMISSIIINIIGIILYYFKSESEIGKLLTIITASVGLFNYSMLLIIYIFSVNLGVFSMEIYH